MATTPAGNPYIESSDLVANYPATSLALANRLDKYAVNPFTDAAARDAAIPTPVQGQLAQTLDDNKVWRYDGTAWAPFSGAVGAASFTDTASGTFSSGGINYKFITYTGTGSITIDVAGFATILIVSAGGAGGSAFGSGGGAGAYLYVQDAYLSASTHAVIVGAGGAAEAAPSTGESRNGGTGNVSRIADYVAPGGAPGIGGGVNFSNSIYSATGALGASGSGATGMSVNAAGASGGSGIVGLGSAGGDVASNIIQASAGGGGSDQGITGRGGFVGANGVGGSGGAGRQSTITNTTVDLAGGGGGCGFTTPGAGGLGGGGIGGNANAGGAASPNTGSGGGGSFSLVSGSIGGNGGSGIVVVRVVV